MTEKVKDWIKATKMSSWIGRNLNNSAFFRNWDPLKDLMHTVVCTACRIVCSPRSCSNEVINNSSRRRLLQLNAFSAGFFFLFFFLTRSISQSSLTFLQTVLDHDLLLLLVCSVFCLHHYFRLKCLFLSASLLSICDCCVWLSNTVNNVCVVARAREKEFCSTTS